MSKLFYLTRTSLNWIKGAPNPRYNLVSPTCFVATIPTILVHTPTLHSQCSRVVLTIFNISKRARADLPPKIIVVIIQTR